MSAASASGQIEVRAFEKLQKALMGLAGERRLLTAG
jgi:hypothetical protein